MFTSCLPLAHYDNLLFTLYVNEICQTVNKEMGRYAIIVFAPQNNSCTMECLYNEQV